MDADVERKATLKLKCVACGVEWTIPLGTDELMIDQELVTAKIDEKKRLEDLVAGRWDEPGAVKQWRVIVTATSENTLRGVRCACF